MTVIATDPIFYGKPLVFNPRNHRYSWGGQAVPAVTTILGRLSKPALIQWAADQAVEHISRTVGETPGPDFDWGSTFSDARKAHIRTRDAAGDVGTALHHYARARLDGQRVAIAADPTLRKVIEAFEEWRGQHYIVPIALERRVFSRQYMYAGTCDFFGQLDGRLCVLDFKTGKGIYDEFWLQTAGYELALMEELGLLDKPLNERMVRWIIRLDKDSGAFEPVMKPPSVAHTEAWIRLVELDRFMRLFNKEAA